MVLRTGAWLLLLIITVPTTLAEPWLESRHDAGRTGRTTDPGPELNETAFVRHLPGPRSLTATPMIIDGSVYVLTKQLGDYARYGYNTTSVSALWRVHLDTGAVHRAVNITDDEYQVDWPTLVSDGDFVYIIHHGRVIAYDPITNTNEEVWAHPNPPAAVNWGWVCNPPTIRERVLYLGCIEASSTDSEESQGGAPTGISSVLYALELNGQDPAKQKWGRTVPPTRPYGAQDGVHAPASPDACYEAVRFVTAPAGGDCQNGVLILGHTVLEGRVIAVLASGIPLDEVIAPPDGPSNEAAIVDGALAAFDAETGTLLWTRHHPTDETAIETASVAANPQNRIWDRVLKVEVTGAEGQLFSREPELAWLKASDGTRLGATTDVSDEDWTRTAQAPGFALDGDELFVTSEQYLHVFDWRTRDPLAKTERPLGEDEFFVLPDITVTNEVTYAKSATLGRTASSGWGRFHSASNHLIAYERAGPSLIEKWRMDFGGGFSPNILWLTYAVGDGVIAVHGLDGNLTVIGRTPASIDVVATVSDLWPAVGEPVRVDLSRTVAGADGAPTRYRADWGDGNQTTWTSEPVFRHTYETGGAHQARLWVANEAGQASVRTLSFGVGLTEPGTENFASRAFAPENQEVTFFVLGLLITLTGALFGFVRLRRRRSLLRKELEKIDHGLTALRHDPEGAERFLREQRLHAETLFTSEKLNAAGHGVLLHRIQTAISEVRLADVTGPLSFIPYGVVKAIREAMLDGRLLANEHDRLVGTVEADQWMTKAQKRKVRARLDDWLAKDSVEPPKLRRWRV